MKLLSLLAAFTTLSAYSPAAHAAQVHCADAEGTLTLTVAVPAGVTADQLARSIKVSEARVHVAAENVRETRDGAAEINDSAEGGLQWDENEGGIAVRTNQTDFLVSVRTRGFDQNGVATGRFEDGAGPRSVPATCRWLD
jgi:hypothetical protein